jgi:hypothetical protein
VGWSELQGSGSGVAGRLERWINGPIDLTMNRIDLTMNRRTLTHFPLA